MRSLLHHAACLLALAVVSAAHADQRHDAASVISTPMTLSFGSSAMREDAAETALAPMDDGWQVDVQPYIWIPARIDGDSTVSGSTANLDLTFGDVLDDFDDMFALTTRVEAWRGEWGLIFDGMYVSIESEFDVEPFGGGPRQLDIDVDVEQAIGDMVLGYRIVDRPLGETGGGPRLRVELLGGMRYQYLKQEIDVSPARLGTSKDWIEPMFGARVSLQLSEMFAIGARADASGFGIGSASNLTWNFLAGVDITFSPAFDLKVGYRVLDIDYDNGSGADEFGLDVTMHGPYLGATFRF